MTNKSRNSTRRLTLVEWVALSALPVVLFVIFTMVS